MSSDEFPENRSRTLSALRWRNWRTGALALLILGAWQLWAMTLGRGSLFFPSPGAVARAGVSLARSGELPRHWSATVARLLAGFLLGAVPAVMVGVWLGVSQTSRRTLDPFIAALHAVPKIAAYPLFLIVFGLGEKSKVAVIAVSTFFPLAINTTAGVHQVPPVYFEVARNYGASPLRTFWRVVLPGSLPLILTGARIAMTLSLLLTVAVEIVGSKSGLGYLVWLSWETLQVANLYVGLMAAALTGIGVRFLFDGAASILVPWREDTRP